MALYQTDIASEPYIRFDRYYTFHHLWVTVSSLGNLTIGITDYAQRCLKEKAFLLELEGDIGSGVEAETVFGAIYGGSYANQSSGYECVIMDLFSPVYGTIVAVNQAVLDKPYLVNDDCYDKGWIAQIKPRGISKKLSALIEPAEYLKLINESTQSNLMFRVYRFLSKSI